MTRPRQVGLWAGLIAATVVAAHLPSFFHRLLDGDEAIYGSIAALLNTGGQLYGTGGADNKPPGVYWLYAAVFQGAGTYQMTAIHAVGLVVILATCALLFMISRDLAGARAGLLAALFYGVLTAAGNPRLLATNTELLDRAETLFNELPSTGAPPRSRPSSWRRSRRCGRVIPRRAASSAPTASTR